MTKKLMRYFIIIFMFLINYSLFLAYGSAGSKPSYENRRIVDMPNCGLIPNKMLAFDLIFMKNGSISISSEYSFLNAINAGISFGGSNILGMNDIYFQKYPGINIKVRVFDETLKLPAIAIGFSNQGFSTYLKEFDRFQTLSPGFYLALSKSFNWKLGYLASHLGVNYSLDNESSKRSPNVYFGIEQSISSSTSINMEYNLQLDENYNTIYGKSGLLNFALRYGILSDLTLELQLKDIFKNYKNNNSIERQFGIEILKSININ